MEGISWEAERRGLRGTIPIGDSKGERRKDRTSKLYSNFYKPETSIH